eukprot:5611610-Pyramimonas_sp.AAC.1
MPCNARNALTKKLRRTRDAHATRTQRKRNAHSMQMLLAWASNPIPSQHRVPSFMVSPNGLTQSKM